MTMKIDGGCHCGFIAYEGDADPDKAAICHCTDCQQLSGSAFRTVVPVADKDFRMTGGAPTIYVKTAESGSKRVQAFCPKCGSPIYSTAPENPEDSYNIRVGTIRQRDLLVPRDQVWTRSAQRWIDSIAAIPSFEKEGAD